MHEKAVISAEQSARNATLVRLSKGPVLPVTTEAEGLGGARPELADVVVPQDEIRRGVDGVGPDPATLSNVLVSLAVAVRRR